MDNVSKLSLAAYLTAAVAIGIAIRLGYISEAAFWGLS